jgi:hypothetical protein
VIEKHPERMSVDQLLTVLMVLDAELHVEPRTPPPSRSAGQTGGPPREVW